MIQWAFDGWLSFGVHLDFRYRENEQRSYGPYIDLHMGLLILSLGYHPVYSGELDLRSSVSRGGLNGDSNC